MCSIDQMVHETECILLTLEKNPRRQIMRLGYLLKNVSENEDKIYFLIIRKSTIHFNRLTFRRKNKPERVFGLQWIFSRLGTF